jgi:hypothetical protein
LQDFMPIHSRLALAIAPPELPDLLFPVQRCPEKSQTSAPSFCGDNPAVLA